MDGLPDAMFVIDVGHENIAIHEARSWASVVAVVDTNCSPDGIDYVDPGNDDAMRAIQLYAVGMADAGDRGPLGGAAAAGRRGRVRRTRRAGQPASEVGPRRKRRGAAGAVARTQAPARRRPTPSVARCAVEGEVEDDAVAELAEAVAARRCGRWRLHHPSAGARAAVLRAVLAAASPGDDHGEHHR